MNNITNASSNQIQQMPSYDQLAEFARKIQSSAYDPVRTDLQFFDRLLGGGIVKQSLLILMAAPGTGKTTLCQQVAETMACHGKDVVYLNFEMSPEQMLAKAISRRLSTKGIKVSTLDVLQCYKQDEKTRGSINAEIESYRSDAYPYIKYNPESVNSDFDKIKHYLDQCSETAEKNHKSGPVIVVDYLHLITDSKSKSDPQDLIKRTVVMLKEYAIKADTFVIAISATNRETNKSGRISLTSGRDSSNIEYTADYEISLNYTAIDSGSVKSDDIKEISNLQMKSLREMTLRVLKNRFGMPGKSSIVYFDAGYNSFYEAADQFDQKKKIRTV